jgi:hypothetical protein
MGMYKLSKWVKSSCLYGELKLLDVRNGTYFKVNKIAQIMWEALLECKSEQQMLNTILDQIEGDPERIKLAFQSFKAQLLQEGWIEKLE